MNELDINLKVRLHQIAKVIEMDFRFKPRCALLPSLPAVRMVKCPGLAHLHLSVECPHVHQGQEQQVPGGIILQLG